MRAEIDFFAHFKPLWSPKPESGGVEFFPYPEPRFFRGFQNGRQPLDFLLCFANCYLNSNKLGCILGFSRMLNRTVMVSDPLGVEKYDFGRIVGYYYIIKSTKQYKKV